MILGVDTGGTFTDFVLFKPQPGGPELLTHKVLSTPDSPECAILQGIAEMGLAEAVSKGEIKVIHGSTVATNAALEGRGVRTAFITNHGFRDILTIARQTRPNLYELEMPQPPVPVPEELCLETGGRVAADGTTTDPLTLAQMENILAHLKSTAPRAVAICLLFSFLDDRHEKRLADFLQERLGPDIFITRSSVVLPQYREYERGVATWLNATLGPLVNSYLLKLKSALAPCPLSVMQSSGGTIEAELAAQKAVNLLLSGPAGGLAAASFIGKSIHEERLMTFDMGGTSTDVALIDGTIRLSSEGKIGPYPVSVPMVDMHTIGAGGGSIAYLDEGNLLRVGPKSAGASPGPASYGKGGAQATVTDANLVLGRLPANAALAGKIKLDRDAACQAIEALSCKLLLTIEETAMGIVTLANEHMARALRVISVEKGHDPNDFRLCCFGGAGGLHICNLAETLKMRRAIVPVNAGVLSAMGMFLAPVERQLARTCQGLLASLDMETLNGFIEDLREKGLQELLEEQLNPDVIHSEVSADLRYQGQSATLTVPWQAPRQAEDEFHELHRARYGHTLPAPVEIVNIRVALKAPGAAHELSPIRKSGAVSRPNGSARLYGFNEAVPVLDWSTLKEAEQIPGPALVLDKTSTVFVTPGWQAVTDNYGNLLIDRI